MNCSAGNEYLHVHHDGSVARCTCRRNVLNEIIGDITSFSPLPWEECDLGSVCERDWLGDWNRSSRDTGRGEFAPGQACLATKLTLTSRCNFSCHYCHPERVKTSNELTAEQWLFGLGNLRRHYLRCWHHIQGTIGEPLLYKGVERVVNGIVEMGDHVTFISNFSGNEKALKAMTSTCPPDRLRFGASMHMTDRWFDMDGFRKRVKAVKSSGHYVEVLLVACPAQIFLHDHIKSLFVEDDIPIRAFYASCQPSTPITRAAFDRMMSSSTSSKTAFSG